MTRLKLCLRFAYIGDRYNGSFSQRRGHTNSVEDYIIDALISNGYITDADSCDLARSGRTDKGVSAFGNYLSCYIDRTDISILKDLNEILPRDIRVLKVFQVENHFDARRSCTKRTYRYYFLKANLNLSEMQLAAQKLVGTHDFRNFCTINLYASKSHIRQLYSFEIKESRSGLWYAQISASSFLYHQVRMMMMVLFRIGRGVDEVSCIDTLLDVVSTPCRPAYLMAHQEGLVLLDCEFSEPMEILSKVGQCILHDWLWEYTKKMTALEFFPFSDSTNDENEFPFSKLSKCLSVDESQVVFNAKRDRRLITGGPDMDPFP